MTERIAPSDITKEMIEAEIDRLRNPEKYLPKEKKAKRKPVLFDDIFDEYLLRKDLSPEREKHYRVIQRAFHRFEMYRRLTGKPNYKFSFDTFTVDDMYDFQVFFQNENQVHDKYPEIYALYPASSSTTRKPRRPSP